MSKSVKLTRKTSRNAGRAGRLPVGELLKSALADDVLRMLSHEPGARDFRPEDVHQLRTSVRRLRSDLRFFGPALQAEHSRGLREELRWLAGVLGAVRDLDVLEQRLREASVSLHAVAETEPIFEHLHQRREASRAGFQDAIDGERYAGLRQSLIAEARSPSLSDEGGQPAGSVLVNRLSKDWRRLIQEVESSPADSPIEHLHQLRKRSKRTRYAAESTAEFLGALASRAARRIARRSRELQETLGILQDTDVAEAFLTEVMDLLPGDGPARSACESMIELQHREAVEARGQYGVLRDRLVGA